MTVAVPEPMNTTTNHSKIKVFIEIPHGKPVVAGTVITGRVKVDCKSEKIALGVIQVEVFGFEELMSRDHSARSTFLHLKRLFQGPGVPPSNAVYPNVIGDVCEDGEGEDDEGVGRGGGGVPMDYWKAKKGISTFLFRIPIPHTLPASIDFANGLAKVRYEVRGSVGVYWKGERQMVLAKQEVEMVESFDVDETLGNRRIGRELISEGVAIGENGKFWVNARVVGGFLVVGESACVEIHVKNHSTRKNSGLVVNLTRLLHLPTTSSEDQQQKQPLQLTDTIVTIPFKGQEYILPPGGEGIANLVFDVPSDARSVKGGLLDIVGGGSEGEGEIRVEALFEIKAFVEVKVIMPIGSKDISLSLPVTIVHPDAIPDIPPPPPHHPYLGQHIQPIYPQHTNIPMYTSPPPNIINNHNHNNNNNVIVGGGGGLNPNSVAYLDPATSTSNSPYLHHQYQYHQQQAMIPLHTPYMDQYNQVWVPPNPLIYYPGYNLGVGGGGGGGGGVGVGVEGGGGGGGVYTQQQQQRQQREVQFGLGISGLPPTSGSGSGSPIEQRRLLPSIPQMQTQMRMESYPNVNTTAVTQYEHTNLAPSPPSPHHHHHHNIGGVIETSSQRGRSIHVNIPGIEGRGVGGGEREEGKGDRASRIATHLRLSSVISGRGRSVSPVAHRFGLGVGNSLGEGVVEGGGWGEGGEVYSPRPQLKHKQSFTTIEIESPINSSNLTPQDHQHPHPLDQTQTQTQTKTQVVLKSDNVLQLEKMAEQIDVTKDLLFADLLPRFKFDKGKGVMKGFGGQGQSQSQSKDEKDININKTLPPHPAPSPPHLPTEPLLGEFPSSPNPNPNPTSSNSSSPTTLPLPQNQEIIDSLILTPLPLNQTPPKPPTLKGYNRPPKQFKIPHSHGKGERHGGNGNGNSTGLDALERRLQLQVGTRKVENEKKLDVRKVLGLDDDNGDGGGGGGGYKDGTGVERVRERGSGKGRIEENKFKEKRESTTTSLLSSDKLELDDSAISSLTLPDVGLASHSNSRSQSRSRSRSREKSEDKEKGKGRYRDQDSIDGKTHKAGKSKSSVIDLSENPNIAYTHVPPLPNLITIPQTTTRSTSIPTPNPNLNPTTTSPTLKKRLKPSSPSDHHHHYDKKKLVSGRVTAWLGEISAAMKDVNIGGGGGGDVAGEPDEGIIPPSPSIPVPVSIPSPISGRKLELKEDDEKEIGKNVNVNAGVDVSVKEDRVNVEDHEVKKVEKEKETETKLLTPLSPISTTATITIPITNKSLDASPHPRSSGFVPIGTLKRDSNLNITPTMKRIRELEQRQREISVIEEAKRVYNIWAGREVPVPKTPPPPLTSAPVIQSLVNVEKDEKEEEKGKGKVGIYAFMDIGRKGRMQTVKTDRKVSPPSQYQLANISPPLKTPLSSPKSKSSSSSSPTSPKAKALAKLNNQLNLGLNVPPKSIPIPIPSSSLTPNLNLNPNPNPNPTPLTDPEVKYDIRSARGGRGGKVTAVTKLWADQTRKGGVTEGVISNKDKDKDKVKGDDKDVKEGEKKRNKEGRIITIPSPPISNAGLGAISLKTTTSGCVTTDSNTSLLKVQENEKNNNKAPLLLPRPRKSFTRIPNLIPTSVTTATTTAAATTITPTPISGSTHMSSSIPIPTTATKPNPKVSLTSIPKHLNVNPNPNPNLNSKNSLPTTQITKPSKPTTTPTSTSTSNPNSTSKPNLKPQPIMKSSTSPGPTLAIAKLSESIAIPMLSSTASLATKPISVSSSSVQNYRGIGDSGVGVGVKDIDYKDKDKDRVGLRRFGGRHDVGVGNGVGNGENRSSDGVIRRFGASVNGNGNGGGEGLKRVISPTITASTSISTSPLSSSSSGNITTIAATATATATAKIGTGVGVKEGGRGGQREMAFGKARLRDLIKKYQGVN